MTLSNIRPLGRYKRPDCSEVNVHKGHNRQRGTDHLFFLRRNHREFITDAEFYHEWKKVSDAPRPPAIAKGTVPFAKRLLGSSGDGRTNRWKLTCGCGKEWEPTTAMLAKRDEECPRCGAHQVVDYNA